MAQVRTITPFILTMPGVDDRILRDVGIDAEGNLLDKGDPRVRRRAIGHPFVGRILKLLSMPVNIACAAARRKPLLRA